MINQIWGRRAREEIQGERWMRPQTGAEAGGAGGGALQAGGADLWGGERLRLAPAAAGPF